MRLNIINIPLTKEILIKLNKLHKKKKNKKDADRIKIILLANDGYTQEQIASILRINKNTISYWIKKFKSKTSINEWINKNYKAYSGKLNSEQIEQLKNYIREHIVIDVKPVINYIKSELILNILEVESQNYLNQLDFHINS